TLNADGSFRYVPNAGYLGTDSFTYRAYDGSTTGNATTVTINVTDIAVSPPSAPTAATAGQAVSSDLASFTDPTPGVTAGQMWAIIDWGDGTTPEAGTVSGSAGVFTVSGDHTYAAAGTYTALVTLSDGSGTSAVARATIVVAAASMAAQGLASSVQP